MTWRYTLRGRTVGSLVMDHEYGRRWWIRGLGVRRAYRRRGYATRLLKQATAWADSRGLVLGLCVRPGEYQGETDRASRVCALTRWYRSMGFRMTRGAEMRRVPAQK